VTDLMFEVVGRSKTEKLTKEGNLETKFRVVLETSDKKHKLTITDANASLLAKYPLRSDVPVKIGKSDQVTLLSEEDLKKEIDKAAEASDQEKQAQ